MEEEWRKKMEEWRKEMEEMELPCIEFEFGGILPGVVGGAASHSHDKSNSSILRDIFHRQLIEFEFGGILPGVVAGAASHSHDESKLPTLGAGAASHSHDKSNSSILRDIFHRQLGSACRQLGSSLALIRRLGRYRELIGHQRAVNSVWEYDEWEEWEYSEYPDEHAGTS